MSEHAEDGSTEKEKVFTDEVPVSVVVMVRTSAGVLRSAPLHHPNHGSKVLGLVKHLQGGTLRLSTERYGAISLDDVPTAGGGNFSDEANDGNQRKESSR